MKTFTDAQRKEIVENRKNFKGSVVQYAKTVGISDFTYYAWAKKFAQKEPVEAVVPLGFNIVQEKEARLWVSYEGHGSRFSAIREGLLQQLDALRKNQAITLELPKDAKEAKAIQSSCATTIRKANLPFSARYSRSKNLLVVLHKQEKVKP